MFIIVFLIILSILVFIHEFGHFIASKKNGVKVEEFGLGFPPRLFGFKIGETLYSLNALPLGGFVKVFGEEYHEVDGKAPAELKKRGFVYKKPWQKSVILVAGVVMNIVLAVAIFYGLLASNSFRSEPLLVFNNHQFRFGQEEGRVIIADVNKGSAAEKAGIKSQESVLSFKNRSGELISVTSASQLITAIKNTKNSPITLDLEDVQNGQKRTVTVTPQYNEKEKRVLIGAQLVDTVVLSYNTPVERLFSGFLHAYNMVVYNVKTIAFLVQSSFIHKSAEPVSQSLSGPIGIASYVKDILNTSGNKLLVNLLNVIALFSLSLATVNILPFPALDGGRLVFVLYEWLTKKRPNPKVEQYFNTAGFTFLMLLMVFISINDVLKLFKH